MVSKADGRKPVFCRTINYQPSYLISSAGLYDLVLFINC